jgi:hypothetical protein
MADDHSPFRRGGKQRVVEPLKLGGWIVNVFDQRHRVDDDEMDRESCRISDDEVVPSIGKNPTWFGEAVQNLFIDIKASGFNAI